MADDNRASEPTDGIDRRTVLKGTAVAGLTAGGATGTASAHDNEISLCSVSDDVFQYRFEVSDSVERGGRYESDSGDRVGERTVEGAASEGRCDSFLFSGELERLELDGPGKVFVNDELVRDTTRPLPNKITVRGQGERVTYEFRASGRIEPLEAADQGDELVASDTVRGFVTGGVDEFRYSGSVVFDSADGPLDVCLELNQH